MMTLLLIAMGGALGSVLRYLLAGWGHGLHGGPLPIGTILVNVIGCIAVGFVAAATAGSWSMREEWRLCIMVGVLGGFTTFSTFGLETITLLQDGHRTEAAVYVVASNVLGIAGAAFGYGVAQKMW